MSHYDCEWISLSPPVLRHGMSAGYPELEWSLPEGPDRRVYRLITFPWRVDADFVREGHRRLSAAWPAHVPHYLCNERRVVERLRRFGISAHLVSRNILIDDEVCRSHRAEKQWDAIYVARLNPLKRHELASTIAGRVLFVGAALDPWDPPGYESVIRRLCPRADLYDGGRRHAASAEVPGLMDQARVGLCLSEVEGAMRVSVEYQLCGLPVVTVRNKGGRNEFLDPEFSRMVPPDPAAVAAAVSELASLRLPADEIRAAVLRRLREHRRRYSDLIQSIWDVEGLQHDFERRLYASVPDRRWRKADEVTAARKADVPWQEDVPNRG